MKLEIFFDYLCPFCEMGHSYWCELLPRHPEIEPVWRPCEAHPRAEEPGGRHSDLAIQGALFVRESGADERAYHDAVFSACYDQGADIEDTQVLAACAVSAGAEKAAFLQALESGAYAAAQRECDRYAYGEKQVQGCLLISSPTADGQTLSSASACRAISWRRFSRRRENPLTGKFLSKSIF